MGVRVDQNLVLLVEPDAELRAGIMATCTLAQFNFIEFDSEDSALDWIWERGKEAAAVFVQQTSSTLADPDSLVQVLGRDWPGIRTIIGESHRGALSSEPVGIDYLPYPWTPWQVAQRLIAISDQRAA